MTIKKVIFTFQIFNMSGIFVHLVAEERWESFRCEARAATIIFTVDKSVDRCRARLICHLAVIIGLSQVYQQICWSICAHMKNMQLPMLKKSLWRNL